MNIAPCHACYACMETHTCAIQDDMKEVFQKLKTADVIVLALPVYFYSVSAQMKAVIDRCLVNHESLNHKKFYFIITAADPQHDAADGTLAAFRGFLRCLPDVQEAGVIYGMGAWDKGMFTATLPMSRLIKSERRSDNGTNQKELRFWVYASADERRRSGSQRVFQDGRRISAKRR